MGVNEKQSGERKESRGTEMGTLLLMAPGVRELGQAGRGSLQGVPVFHLFVSLAQRHKALAQRLGVNRARVREVCCTHCCVIF